MQPCWIKLLFYLKKKSNQIWNDTFITLFGIFSTNDRLAYYPCIVEYCNFLMIMYLQVIEHSEGGHARGRGAKQRLQDGRCALLVLLFTGQRRWLRGLRTRSQCKQSFLWDTQTSSYLWSARGHWILLKTKTLSHDCMLSKLMSKCWVIQLLVTYDSNSDKLQIRPSHFFNY